MDARQRRIATELLATFRAPTEPSTCAFLGQEWDVLPTVVAPDQVVSAALYAEWLRYPIGGSFCEVGCGSGIYTVLAAQRGCQRVVGIDINPAAVQNTALNAERHGVGARVDARLGSMFEPLAGDERFDVIFWNSAHLEVDPDFESTDVVDFIVFDPGFDNHDAYFRDARRHLADRGRLFIGWTDLGDEKRLEALASKHRFALRPRRRSTSVTPQGPMEFRLLEFLDEGQEERTERGQGY
jgi:release factor glutamine methyltransferase